MFFRFIPEKDNEKYCAIFTLELYCKKLAKCELESILSYFNVNIDNIEKEKSYYFLNIFSSEMNINIICEHVNFESNKTT